MEELGDFIDISPMDLLLNSPHLRCLHGKSAEASGGDRIHAQTVTDIIEIGNLFDLVNHAEATKCFDRLILRPFDFQTFMPSLSDLT